MFKSFLDSLLTESKQDIMGLGYPEIIAKLFYKRYGHYAFLIARWYRDYRTHDPQPNWFNWAHSNYRQNPDLASLIQLYDGTKSPELYKQVLSKLELSHDDDEVIDDYYLEEQRKALLGQIEAKFFDEVFFRYYSIINDISSGKLRDIAPYRDLSFLDAQHKYEQKQVFLDRKPIKVYNNGFRWVDVGKHCSFLGDQMRNCGSAGLMSNDEDRTILALFDANNKAHVMVTYSPNEKRISGDEGGASTEVKIKYHRYVLDLVKTLGAKFSDSRKSDLLNMKYRMQGKATNIKQVSKDLYNKIYQFNLAGQRYYSNGNVAVSQQDLQKAQQAIASGQANIKYKYRNLPQTVFNVYNQPILASIGVKYIPNQTFYNQT